MKIFPRENYIMSFDKWESNCPFCNLEEDLVIWRWKYLCIRHNKYPYLWMKEHLLVIPYRHVCESSNLTKEEFWEFVEVESFMKKFYKKEYFSFIRQWWNAKSIKHVHYHYLPWEVYPSDVEDFLLRQWFQRNTNFD